MYYRDFPKMPVLLNALCRRETNNLHFIAIKFLPKIVHTNRKCFLGAPPILP